MGAKFLLVVEARQLPACSKRVWSEFSGSHLTWWSGTRRVSYEYMHPIHLTWNHDKNQTTSYWPDSLIQQSESPSSLSPETIGRLIVRYDYWLFVTIEGLWEGFQLYRFSTTPINISAIQTKFSIPPIIINPSPCLTSSLCHPIPPNLPPQAYFQSE